MKELLRVCAVFVAAAVVVHVWYVQVVRPMADAALEAARLAGQSAPREWAVILKDWEQELCLILLMFCAVRIAMKWWELTSEQYLFDVDVFKDADDAHTPVTGTLDVLESLPSDVRRSHLMETLQASLRRYHITGDVQNTSDAVQVSVEMLGMRLEADNAMIRYMIWVIPSIGFIGTVRGIGQALSQADAALAGDIVGMTASLGTAFNSTLVALLASVALMLLFHVLQRAQDKRLIDIQAYCETFLLKRISATHR